MFCDNTYQLSLLSRSHTFRELLLSLFSKLYFVFQNSRKHRHLFSSLDFNSAATKGQNNVSFIFLKMILKCLWISLWQMKAWKTGTSIGNYKMHTWTTHMNYKLVNCFQTVWTCSFAWQHWFFLCKLNKHTHTPVDRTMPSTLTNLSTLIVFCGRRLHHFSVTSASSLAPMFSRVETSNITNLYVGCMDGWLGCCLVGLVGRVDDWYGVCVMGGLI